MTDTQQFDLQHIWHPYSSLTNPIAPLHVKSANGVTLTLNNGQQLIDGMASWWSVIHGYNQPDINRAAISQIEQLPHVMFGGLTHDPAIELCQRLVALTPASLTNVFLSDSGSIAVDIALKMSLQYWAETGQKTKTRFVALRGGYHGDTLGAMSVCDPDTGMHHLFNHTLAKQYFVERPACKFGEPCEDRHISGIAGLLEINHQTIAAIILEPIVQGAGGMYFYSAEYLKKIRQLCNQYNVLLIADEIATGFGRTGKFFACEHADIEPDILCIGKAMTGGYLSLAATLTTTKIAEGICNGQAGAFMHGPTFMANPLACKIACTSIDLLEEKKWKDNVDRIEQQLKKRLAPLQQHAKISNIRTLGAIGVIETKCTVNMQTAQALLPSLGVWLRPFGKLIYTMPPYITNNQEIDKICEAMLAIVEQCT